MRKVIISVAPVSLDIAERGGLEFTPAGVAEETTAAAREGAGIVHFHVRDRQGRLSGEITHFRRTVDLIRAGSDIIIQGSTGGLSQLSLDERCAALAEKRVELASLNMGSVNMDEDVYINTMPDIRYWASRMQAGGVKPEFEIFEGGMVNNVRLLDQEMQFKKPLLFAFCLGVKGALPATAYNLHFLRGLLPPDAIWGLIHHGMQDFSLLAAAVGMGAGFIRVGFEDSPFLTAGRQAACNAQLVKKAAALIEHLGLEVAPADEAREILGLK